MKDRWALCALGAWLMGSVIMIAVATRNFRLVDELLQASPNAHFQELVQRWGAGVDAAIVYGGAAAAWGRIRGWNAGPAGMMPIGCKRPPRAAGHAHQGTPS